MSSLAWARASLVANIGIVFTGALVRLTDSGLGCPTWPKCTAERWTTHPALGIHGYIEFGNRLITYVLIAIAIGTLVSVRNRPGPRRLAIAIALGIPFQGVIGGLTVLTDLNPWLVSLHLVLSLILICLAVVLIDQVRDEPRTALVGGERRVVAATVALVAPVVYVGTIVTGSGPHAGDAVAPRNGLDAYLFSHVHAGLAYALLAVTLLCVVLVRGPARRSALLLLLVELLQAGIGIAQYTLGLPIALVALHLLGAALLVAAATALAVRAWVSREPTESTA